VSEMIRQLRADVRNRPTMILLLVAGAALVAAVAWVALGTHAEGTPANASVSQTPVSVPPAHNVADGPKRSAERRRHARHRRRVHRITHAPQDPFAPLEEEKSEESKNGVTKNAPSTPSTSSPNSSSTTPPNSGSPTKPAPTKPYKRPTYTSIVHFEVTAQSEGEPFALTSNKISIKAAKPTNSPALLTLAQIGIADKSASYKLGTNVKMTSGGKCLPSTKNCTFVELHPGHTAKFEWTRSGEPAVEIEMLITKITRDAGPAKVAATRSK